MSSLIFPETCLRYSRHLLLSSLLALQASCGSNTQLVTASAPEAEVQYADSPGSGYAIEAPNFVRGNEYEKGHVVMDIVREQTPPSASDAYDSFVVTASVPLGVDITSATLVYDDADGSGLHNRRVDDCEVEEHIMCRYEGSLVENASLELSYKIFAPGDHEFTVSIDASVTDADSVNDARTIIFRYVASMRYLQSLMDATESNGSIVLPSGTYMGTLHGGDRLLTVQGAADGGTVLLSDNLDMPLLEHIGTGSVFSNLELRSSGAPILVRSGYNVTIRDSLIAPIQGAWHDLSQLFVSNSYRLLYSRVEGWGGEQGDCRSLLVSESYPSSTWPSGIYIQNTVFRDNTCNNILLEYSANTFPFDANASVETVNPSLFILNNTFVNNKGRIHFSANRANDVHIRNNIFDAHQDPITLSGAIDHTGEVHLVFASNLVWNSPFNSLFSADVTAESAIRVEAPDLIADPLFADRDSGDFSLATGSPAMDAGATINAYLWTDPKTGSGVVPLLQAREPTPLDGLLDGNVIMDIGAFEYIP